MKKNISINIFCLIFILAFCFQQTYAVDKNGTSSTYNSIANLNSNEYKIGSGDILDIMTWKEPDFSKNEVLVRIDGKITFPLLNDIQAAYRTPIELQNDITERLKTYVENPIVTVTVVNSGSQKFYILGEVIRTGEYELKKDLTVLQAFAMAGGFTEWASKNEIILLRNNNDMEKAVTYYNPTTSSADTILIPDKKNKESIIRINYKNIIKGRDLSQNIKIKANDTIIVP